MRYYTRIGLISAVKNPENGYKTYAKAVQQRLKFILSARQLGFSVDEIKDILVEADKGHTACPLVREIVQHRLEANRKAISSGVVIKRKAKKRNK